MSLLRRYLAPVSERQRSKIRVYKIYVIPLYVAWYKKNPDKNGYGVTKERAIANLLKKA